MKIKDIRYFIPILAFFGILYSLISIINHYLFRTYALDLGLYTNALYKYGHLRMADSLMMKDQYEPLLGGHFDLYLMLFSPFVYLFGTYTLLVLQIIFILAGGLGVYNYFMIKENSSARTAHLAALYFLLFFGVFSAVSFDYHSVVVASCLIPWFFYFFHKRKYVVSSILVLLILISQENISLVLIFLFLGLTIDYRKERVALYLLLTYCVVSVVYFTVITQVVIPAFSATHSYGGFDYPILGDTPFEAIKSLVLNPIQNLKVLFINHNNSPFGDYVKLETHLILLLSGVYLLFVKPQYLWMLLPIYGQKLYHDENSIWSIAGQYSIEFAPILAIGIFSVIISMKNRRKKNIFMFIIMFGALASTIRVMDHTVQFTNKSAIRFYQKSHYQRDYNVQVVHQQLNLIPKTAKVSAQSPFVPHLSLRNTIYQFPKIKDADYVVFSIKESFYPLTREDFFKEINMVLNSDLWKIEYENEHFTILKRINLQSKGFRWNFYY